MKKFILAEWWEDIEQLFISIAIWGYTTQLLFSIFFLISEMDFILFHIIIFVTNMYPKDSALKILVY